MRNTAFTTRPLSWTAALAQALWSAAVLASASAAAQSQDTASFAVDTELKLHSDVRSRGISDSLRRPGMRLTLQAAHESGVIGLVELATVSKRQFLDGAGYSVVLGTGYRFGDAEGWHFGVGAAGEWFPEAGFEAPHGFDLASFTPTDFRRTRYDSQFALLELGYGALEARVMNVLSMTYRGINTGGVCATQLMLNPDPQVGLDCYARGDLNSRGSWLFDLNYKRSLAPNTWLTLHLGHQKIRHFEAADLSDAAIGLVHKRWGFEFTAEWLTTHTQARELYIAFDGDRARATDGQRLVATVARKF